MATVSSTSEAFGGGCQVAKFSDGWFGAFWWNGTDQKAYYSLSADGSSWSAETFFFTTTFGNKCTVVQVGNVVYAHTTGRFQQDSVITKLTYSTLTNTITASSSATYGQTEIFPGVDAFNRIAYDADHTLLHVYESQEAMRASSPSSLTTAVYTTTNPFSGLVGYVYCGNAIYVMQNGVVKSASVSGSAYGSFSSITAKASANTSGGVSGGVDTRSGTAQPYFVAADSTTNTLDYYSFNGTTWTVTALVSSASIASVDTGTYDTRIYAVYRTNTTYANGEIYLIKRVGGTWGAPLLVAGGSNSGFTTPSLPQTMSGSDPGGVPILYVAGTSIVAAIENPPFTLTFTASAGAASTTLSLYQLLAMPPDNGAPVGDATIGGFAINSRILPAPDVVSLPEDSPNSFLAASTITLALSELDLTLVDYLGGFSSPAQASLAIRLAGGWIVDIPVLLRAVVNGSIPGSITLYVTTLRDVLLVTPRYPAQIF